jgi:hypothetical protein
MQNRIRTQALCLVTFVTVVALGAAGAAWAGDGQHTSTMFMGPKANTGTVSHVVEGNKDILRVSSDFKVPDTPAPTWRVVDSMGNVYTLDAFKIKGGEKREIEVPSFVHDVAKVQVYCAWAQVLLGEAGFSSPVMLEASR